jgi:hypothetical protein
MTSGNGATPHIAQNADLPQPARRFEADGLLWLAWLSGSSAYGTGTCGPAALEAVHFAHAEAPTQPVYEALLAAGRFHGLFDDELIALLRAATRIVDPSDRPVKAANRRGSGLL